VLEERTLSHGFRAEVWDLLSTTEILCRRASRIVDDGAVVNMCLVPAPA
jgi:hypothetical protein